MSHLPSDHSDLSVSTSRTQDVPSSTIHPLPSLRTQELDEDEDQVKSMCLTCFTETHVPGPKANTQKQQRPGMLGHT